ncbi:MAG: NAD(P)H-dependent glycerol-3-phosphate dehydrogenase [Lautropia sp.]|nr:NAD(P)H-dependent glycerol-3-phosphate dehydrogenase [Lautropia sp.]
MKVGILGAGAWGTALAIHVAARHRVVLWSRNPAVLRQIGEERINRSYLPEVPVPAGVHLTDDPLIALKGADLVVLATSVAGIRPVARQVASLRPRLNAADVSGGEAGGAEKPLRPGFVCLSKGLEAQSRALPHQVFSEVLPGYRFGSFSGPSFAQEVAAGLPVALTAASQDEGLRHTMVQAFHHGAMRVYRSADLIGVEIAGALKNIIAVATGICDGLGLGLNARAALLTRGLAEITRFGLAHGASAETFLGLAGVGDLVLTCTGDLSRNRRVGLLLAQGRSLPDILASLGHVAEGVACCPAVVSRAAEAQIEMPISQAVLAVTEGRLSAREAVAALLAREPRQE